MSKLNIRQMWMLSIQISISLQGRYTFRKDSTMDVSGYSSSIRDNQRSENNQWTIILMIQETSASKKFAFSPQPFLVSSIFRSLPKQDKILLKCSETYDNLYRVYTVWTAEIK